MLFKKLEYVICVQSSIFQFFFSVYNDESPPTKITYPKQNLSFILLFPLYITNLPTFELIIRVLLEFKWAIYYFVRWKFFSLFEVNIFWAYIYREFL